MRLSQLTKAEELIMQVVWKLNKECVVKDIIEHMPKPKPAYNTASTVLRVLERKGFIDHKAYGNSYVYFSKVSEKEYKKFAIKKILTSYFNNSYHSLVSFLFQEELNVDKHKELLQILKEFKNKKQ